jgi:hypothetical protein
LANLKTVSKVFRIREQDDVAKPLGETSSANTAVDKNFKSHEVLTFATGIANFVFISHPREYRRRKENASF